MQQYRFTKVTHFPARGGPEKSIKPPGERYTRTPTTPGRYVIAFIAPFLSHRYRYWSGITWGTKMRLEKNVVQVFLNGKWINLSKANSDRAGMSEDAIKKEVEEYYNKTLKLSGFPDKWVFGDFGHTTIQYFKDLNNDFMLNGKEHIMGDMIHTTPPDEAATFLDRHFDLAQSHGCVHVRPNDIDIMIHAGFAGKGQVVEVHDYSETAIKSSFTREKFGKPPYELHFFPGCPVTDPQSATGTNTGVIIIYAVDKI